MQIPREPSSKEAAEILAKFERESTALGKFIKECRAKLALNVPMAKSIVEECDTILQSRIDFQWFGPVESEIDGRIVTYFDDLGNVVTVDSTSGEVTLVEGGSR